MDTSSLDSEIQLVLEQQDIIIRTMAQLFPSRIVSTTESQLEFELANLVFGHPGSDYAETSQVKSDDVK